jgi:hypothetical protein
VDTHSIFTIFVDKEKLEESNFCFPIRKKRLQPLHDEESNFNAMFGGFRSLSEATFGDLMKTFTKFNNKEILRTTCKTEFNLAFRLCLLLLNVRNFVRAFEIEEQPHHREWMTEGVDYPRKTALSCDDFRRHFLDCISARMRRWTTIRIRNT